MKKRFVYVTPEGGFAGMFGGGARGGKGKGKGKGGQNNKFSRMMTKHETEQSKRAAGAGDRDHSGSEQVDFKALERKKSQEVISKLMKQHTSSLSTPNLMSA